LPEAKEKLARLLAPHKIKLEAWLKQFDIEVKIKQEITSNVLVLERHFLYGPNLDTIGHLASFNAETLVEDSRACSMCTDDLDIPDMKKLPCGHVYPDECV
jgi:hypothetical protein